MNTSDFESLMNKADENAQTGEWGITLDLLEQAINANPNHIGALTGIGKTLLNLGRASDAIVYFRKVANLASNVPETHNNLGVAYLVSGELFQAEVAFKEALWLDDDDAQAWKNLAQVYLQQKEKLTEGVQILAAVVQSNPEDIDALFQLALCYEIGEDYESAKFLLQKILGHQPDHALAQEVLDDIIRIDQPDFDRIARPEHAKKLAGLKNLIQKTDKPLTDISLLPLASSPAPSGTYAFYGPDEFSRNQRLPALTAHYRKQGIELVLLPEYSSDHLDQYDSMVFYDPNLSGVLVDAVNQCIQHGKRYHVDFDIDLLNIPEEHPAYSQVGPGNPNTTEVISIIMEQAETVTAASSTLAQRYRAMTKQIEIALPHWSDEDQWWNRPTPARNTLNIGWLGGLPELSDLDIVRPQIEQYLFETPNAIWVAVGHQEVYEYFPELPEDRRLFLPPPTSEAFAYLFTNFDILLIPLADNAFNQAKSDSLLLYAGIRKIPWVASPIPAFQEWEKGGILASNADDWYSQLIRLSGDIQIRKQLGVDGRIKAETRKLSR